MTSILNIQQRILEKAIHGKLVPENNQEEHASVLYKKIQEVKKSMLDQSLIKKEKSLSLIVEGEAPFELPENWIWVRLGEISNFIDYRGKTPKKTETGVKLITAKNVKKGIISEEPKEFINESEYASWMTRGIPKKGDILFTTEAPLGNVAQIELDDIFALAQRIIAIQPYKGVDGRYLKYVLMSPTIQEMIFNKATGTTVLGIKSSRLKEVLIPLPPANNQLRIVDEIEKLFSICHQWKEEVEFQQNHIEILQEKILKDAFSGLLVPQDENDEPAAIILENITAKREQLIKDKKLTKSKPLAPIEGKEKFLELPSGWKWIKLGEISKVIHYGYTASATEKNTGVRMVRITDIQDDKVNWETVPFCEIEEGSVEKYQLKNNDILIARTGGTVGKSFLVDNSKYISVFASYLIRIQLFDDVNAGYVKRFLESDLYWNQIKKQAKGTGQPNVNATGLSNLVLPLPPKEEQDRIVEKVDDIWETINEIEKNMVLAV